MCFDICTINIRVSIRVRGLHLVLLVDTKNCRYVTKSAHCFSSSLFFAYQNSTKFTLERGDLVQKQMGTSSHRRNHNQVQIGDSSDHP